MLKAHYRSAALNADGSWTYDLESCIQQFMQQFPDIEFNRHDFVNHKHNIIRRFEEKICICKGKSPGRQTKLTEETQDDIQHRMTTSPKKSLRNLSVQTGLLLGTVHTAVKKRLHLYPYKVSVVHQLLPPDFASRRRYCEWFNENLAHNNNLLDLTFFTDKAWFHLSGYVNSQTFCIWGTEDPHETPLHPQKIGVWVAISRRRILEPIFFQETVTAEQYKTIILQELFAQVHDDELENGFLQRNNAPAHTARETITFLEEFCDDRIISQGLWPSRSPDFYLFGRLKNNIFKNRLHTLEELQEVIT